MTNLTFATLISLAFILHVDCSGTDILKEWIKLDSIPESFLQVSAQNVLRCGKLCEKQGRCASATFDQQTRVCYMHDGTDPCSQTSITGRYLHKMFAGLKNDADVGCDANTEIVLPSAQQNDHCYSFRGLVGQNCSVPEDCVVLHSECSEDGTCRCKAGYSFRRESTTCETKCDDYGDTFQPFHSRGLVGSDEDFKSLNTPEECMQFCCELKPQTCLTFDFRVGSCYIKAVNSLDRPDAYGQYVGWTHYQRNCA